jgi:hypothetical protein
MRLRGHVFRISETAVDFQRRGFRGASLALRSRLESVGSAFLAGYHRALESGSLDELEDSLAQMDLERRGFAFEGAGMGLALLEFLTPWSSSRVARFLRGAGDSHAYMIHVGIGWVWARLPFGFRRWQRRLDPLLGWLAFDGWGFHEGFFHWPKYISGQTAPSRLKGYERRVFDQGLGRSFWFVNGGDVELLSRTIAEFHVERRGDLWSGIGLAATYAGIISESALGQLHEKAGPFQSQLAQGAAFAAKARQRAGNLTDYTGLAAKVLCRLSAEDAAKVTDEALENLPKTPEVPSYEIWRRRIQQRFASSRQPQGELK